MTIEQAIRKAIRNGWGGLEWHADVKIEGNADTGISANIWGASRDRSTGHVLPLAVALLDHEFWQALRGGAKRRSKNGARPAWLHDWHRCIDHLAEGGALESFFASLK